MSVVVKKFAPRCFVSLRGANIIVAYHTDQGDKTEELPELFTKVLNIMTSGFAILKG